MRRYTHVTIHTQAFFALFIRVDAHSRFGGKGDIGPNVSGEKYIIPAACVFLLAASSSCSARATSKRFQRKEAACDWNA